MSRHDPVMWSEGLLLSPQHLQQWDRYVRHYVTERSRATQGFDWGLTKLDVDEEALRNGRIALKAASGILPDGTPFSMPEGDPLPPARAIESEFGTQTDSVIVHLGVPIARPGRPGLGKGNGTGAPAPRFSPATVDLADETTGEDERPVVVGRRNFRLLGSDDPLADYDAIPIAEIVRTSDTGYARKDGYVPPCLSIEASDVLMRLLRTELEMLVTKSSELGDRRRQRGGVADFSSSDGANFWLLHTVNSIIPILAHYVGHHRAHPEQVFLTLSSLAGTLCTFSTDLHPRDLPSYEHAGLGSTFERIHGVLSRLLETVIPTKAVRIDLEQRDSSLHVGRIDDPRLLEPGASLFLGVHAEAEEQTLVLEVPTKFKVASMDQIDFLIANALRGVSLNFVRVPPASLPVKASYVYFELDAKSEVWDAIKGSKTVAVFAPPDFKGLSLELLGLRE